MYNTLPISNQKTKSFRVGLYIRLSREDGDKEESSSVTNQREILKRYVSEQPNFFIVKEYVDDGVSEKEAIKIVARERDIAKSIVYSEYHNRK